MQGKGAGPVNRVELESQVLCAALRQSLHLNDKIGAFTSVRELSHLFPDLLPPPEKDDEASSVNKSNYYGLLKVKPQTAANGVLAAYLRAVRKFLLAKKPAEHRVDYIRILNAGFVLRKPRLRLSHDLVVSRRWLHEESRLSAMSQQEITTDTSIPAFAPDASQPAAAAAASAPAPTPVAPAADMTPPPPPLPAAAPQHSAPTPPPLPTNAPTPPPLPSAGASSAPAPNDRPTPPPMPTNAPTPPPLPVAAPAAASAAAPPPLPVSAFESAAMAASSAPPPPPLPSVSAGADDGFVTAATAIPVPPVSTAVAEPRVEAKEEAPPVVPSVSIEVKAGEAPDAVESGRAWGRDTVPLPPEERAPQPAPEEAPLPPVAVEPAPVAAATTSGDNEPADFPPAAVRAQAAAQAAPPEAASAPAERPSGRISNAGTFVFDESQLRRPAAPAEAPVPIMVQLLEMAQIIGSAEVQALKAQMELAPNIPVEKHILNNGYISANELASVKLGESLLQSGKITMAQFQVAFYDERVSGLRMAESLQVRGWLSVEVRNAIDDFHRKHQ